MINKGEKIKTSVFSEYQNNENDSISSRQLEYWLKQTAPVAQPKFSGVQWTLMSTNSIFEQDQHTLRRTQTFESLNKQNDQLAYNSAKPTLNSSSLSKSKSYVNAMVDLQNRVKQLQQQNKDLKHSVGYLKEERSRTMSESSNITQQLRNKLEGLEPKTKKMEELVKENKKLRDLKQEYGKQSKLLQRINKQGQSRFVEYEKQIQKLTEQLKSKEQSCRQLQKTIDQQLRGGQKTKQTLNKLHEKNKILQDMKQKSTTSIIEKYNKSVEMVEALTTQNMKFQLQVQFQKEKGQEKLRKSEQKWRKERQQLMSMIQRIKQQLIEKKEVITTLSKDNHYFKQNYDKTNEQLINSLRNHAKEIKQIKEAHSKQLNNLRQKEIVYIQKRIQQKKEEGDINKQSMIKIEQIGKNLIEYQLELQQLHSIEQDQLEEMPPIHETRSVQKQMHKPTFIKQTKRKPIDSLSQQNCKISGYINQKSSGRRASNHQTNKSRKSSHEKIFENIPQQYKSGSKFKQIDRKPNHQNQQSFILKSCKPATQYQHTQHLMYSRQPYFHNSANHNPTKNSIPYYWKSRDVPQFDSSQRGSGSNQVLSLEKALLIEANKEAIRLIEEQQKCIIFLNQNESPNERASNLGRMKQISEQIKINNEKMVELKNKLSST